MEYNRIIYPERAEYLKEDKFSSYRIFLEHWDSLALKIKSNFEEAILRSVSKTLMIVGAQSTGKTMLANKLSQDFEATSKIIKQGKDLFYDKSNIWHRTVTGFTPNIDLVKKNTHNAVLIHIEDDSEWIDKVKSFCESNQGRTVIVVADNCEREYFLKGLLGLNDIDYLKIDVNEKVFKSAAQKYVALCRGVLRGAVMLMFTNDQNFSRSFEDAVNTQHVGLVESSSMPMPSPVDKETVIRVNTNRLNYFSYWYCLDRAGIAEKKIAYQTLKKTDAESGYKSAFEAIDRAIQMASATRMGRPPKKCLLTFFVFVDTLDVDGLLENLSLGECDSHINKNPFVNYVTYNKEWINKLNFLTERERRLLNSEWNLRVALVGNAFVDAVLSEKFDKECADLINKVLTYHGPGTHLATLEKFKTDFDNSLDFLKSISINNSKISDFWSAGQNRSTHYEPRLKVILPKYNITHNGFLNYRPDYCVTPYTACQLTGSATDEENEINASIRRNAVCCEFTAIKDISSNQLIQYIDKKLQNYVEITQEQ